MKAISILAPASLAAGAVFFGRATHGRLAARQASGIISPTGW